MLLEGMIFLVFAQIFPVGRGVRKSRFGVLRVIGDSGETNARHATRRQHSALRSVFRFRAAVGDHAGISEALEDSPESMESAILPSALNRFLTAALIPGPEDPNLLALMS